MSVTPIAALLYSMLLSAYGAVVIAVGLEPVYDNNARAIILSIGCTLLGLYGLWYVFYYRRKEAKEEAAAGRCHVM